MTSAGARAKARILVIRTYYALGAALVLLCPAAFAQAETQAFTGDARVELAWADGIWNGASSLSVPAPAPGPTPGAGPYVVWLPPQATLHSVRFVNATGASAPDWEHASRESIRVVAPPGGEVVARFSLPDRAPSLARYVAPAPVASLSIMVAPPQGRVFEGADEHGMTMTGPLAAGDALTVRVVDEGRVGELPILLTILILSALALALARTWHAARPPLGGRAPEKFLDHLGELQARLVPAVVAFALLNVLYFVAGLRTMAWGAWTVPAPSWGTGGSLASRAFDAIAERLVPPDVPLLALRPADAVVAQIGIALFLAFVTVLPLLVYELWAFVAPALEPRERRVALAVTPVVSGLFVAGALVGYLLMAPLMLRTLYAYAPAIGAQPVLGVGDLVSFALLVVLAFAIAFELPVAMFTLARLGLVGAGTFWKYLRHAVVAIVLLAGLITPDPSVVSQVLVAGPIIGLYVLGIGAAQFAQRRRRLSTAPSRAASP